MPAATLEAGAHAIGEFAARLTDADLDRLAPNSLYGDAPLTCQFMLEDRAVRHSFHHLARIRGALRRPVAPASASRRRRRRDASSRQRSG